MSKEDNPTNKNEFILDFGSQGSPFEAVKVKQDESEANIADDADDLNEDIAEDVNIDDDTGSDNDDADDGDSEEFEEEENADANSGGSDDSDDADADTDGESEEGDDDLNIYYHIASDLKNDNFLGEDFEISKDIDGTSLKESIKTRLKSELEPSIKNEVHQELINLGYSDEDLLVARAIRQGVDVRLLSTASMYETYSKMANDASDTDKESVISGMYRARGFNEDEIKNQINISKDDENPTFDKLYKDSKEFFAGKYGEFVAQENTRNEEIQAQQSQSTKQTNDLINRVVSEKKILGRAITADQARGFEDSLRKPTEIIEVNGQKYSATEAQKFLYEFQTNDELKLLAFFLHKFKDEHTAQIKKDAKKSVEKDFLDGYKNRVVRKKPSKNKNISKQLDDRKDKSNSYMIDLTSSK
jgi:hypothetical protein